MLPVVKHRLCIDYFLSYAAWLFVLITFLWAFVATLLSAGLSLYFLACGLITLALLPCASYGEWAIAAHDVGHVYTYAVAQFWLALALVWSAGAGYVHLRQGKEVIEETWYALSTQIIIPFTTQLQFKSQFENFGTVLLGLGITTGLLCMQGVMEGWKALGGHLIMINYKLAAALPEAVAILLLAGGSASYATYGASVAAFATAGNSGVFALNAHATMSFFTVLLGIAHLVVPLAWGNSVLGHFLLSVAGTLSGFCLFVTSLTLQSRAATVDEFVRSRWDDSSPSWEANKAAAAAGSIAPAAIGTGLGLQQFVPERFQGLAWDKYAEASYTPMQEAAMTGLLLSIILLCSSLHHYKMATLLWSVGPQLAAARIRFGQQYSRIVSGAATMLLPTHLEAVREWSVNPASSSGAGSAEKKSYESVSISGASSFLGGSSGKKGYGAISVGNEDPLSAPLSSSETVSSASELSSSTGSATGYQETATAGAYKRHAAGATAAAVTEIPAGFEGGAVAAAEIRARYLAMQQYSMTTVSFQKIVEAVGARAQAPTLIQWLDVLKSESVKVARPHVRCLTGFGVLALVFIVGISVGLTQLFSATSQCAILAENPATSTYSTWFQLESGGRGRASVFIDHSFPFGSVQVDAEVAEAYPSPRTDNVTVILTAYSADGRNLPSQAQLRAMVNLSTDCFNGPPDDSNDDDAGGCLAVSFNLAPAAGISWTDARNRCLGLRIRIITATPALFWDVRSRSAYVNVTGNAVQFVDSILNANGKISAVPPIMQSLAVTTDTAAIIGVDVYAARFGDVGPTFTPSLVMTSNKGNMFLRQTVAQGARFSTGGNIVSTTLLSASTACAGICGDVGVRMTGSGKFIASQLVAAYSLDISSDSGDIIFSNVGIDFATDMKMTSNSGGITMSNFVAVRTCRSCY